MAIITNVLSPNRISFKDAGNKNAILFQDHDQVWYPSALNLDVYTKDDKISNYADRPSETSIIPNFHTVDNGVYRGSAIVNYLQAFYLKQLGVKTVINLIGNNPELVEKENQILDDSGINHVHFEMKASCAPTEEQVRSFLHVVSEARKQGGVYIHCKGGKDRTGIMCSIYRLFYNGWDKDRAFQEMKECGYNGFHQVKFPAQMHYLYSSDLDRAIAPLRHSSRGSYLNLFA